jgi:hypothetical protein
LLHADSRVAAGVGVAAASVAVAAGDVVMQVLALLEFACNVLLHVWNCWGCFRD